MVTITQKTYPAIFAAYVHIWHDSCGDSNSLPLDAIDVPNVTPQQAQQANAYIGSLHASYFVSFCDGNFVSSTAADLAQFVLDELFYQI